MTHKKIFNFLYYFRYCFTFSTVIGRFAYRLRLTAIRFFVCHSFKSHFSIKIHFDIIVTCYSA